MSEKPPELLVSVIKVSHLPECWISKYRTLESQSPEYLALESKRQTIRLAVSITPLFSGVCNKSLAIPLPMA